MHTFENLRRSEFGWLAEAGAIRAEMPEAEMGRAVAVRIFGLAEPWLLMETASRNCGENARFAQRTLWEAFGRPVKAVVVQDPTMQRRAVETWRHLAEQDGLALEAVSWAAFQPAMEPGADGQPRMAGGPGRTAWTVERFIGLLLGEMERLNDDERGYGPRGRGFLGHVEIAPELLEAWRRMERSPWARLAER